MALSLLGAAMPQEGTVSAEQIPVEVKVAESATVRLGDYALITPDSKYWSKPVHDTGDGSTAFTCDQPACSEAFDLDISKVPAGDYLNVFKRDKLKLTEAQTEKLQAIQKDFNPRISMMLTEEQKHTVEDFKQNLAEKNLAAATRTPRKAGNTLFRATRYGLNHPAFDGRTLTPGKTLVEIEQEREHPQPNQETNLAGPKTGDATK